MYGIKVDKPAKKFKKLNFKNLKVGDKFIWVVDDFDGYSEDKCMVTEICDDHIIVVAMMKLRWYLLRLES